MSIASDGAAALFDKIRFGSCYRFECSDARALTHTLTHARQTDMRRLEVKKKHTC